MPLLNKEQTAASSGNQQQQSQQQHSQHHQHPQQNMLLNDTQTNHHHHSRLLYFLTDPSQAMLSLSRFPFNRTNPPNLPLEQQHSFQQPFLFPTPTLTNNTIPKPKASSSKTTKTILPTPALTTQPIAVAAVDDCCNQCCPVIAAESTNPTTVEESNSPVITNKRRMEQDTINLQSEQPTTKRAKNQDNNEKENENEEGETKCKWSSCVASFNTVEDLTPHLFKNHLNNSRKQQQSNTCFWESCSDLIVEGDLVHHLTSQHLKNTLLHACRWINCSERFEGFETLTIHLSQVHVGCGKSEYICHWVACERQGKVFTQRQKIMRHIQTHTGAKPYQCSTCQKRFSESNIMTQHMRTHTGEKPFKCDLCEREFSVSASLTIHKRVHSGEKPFSCRYQDCNKRFAESSNLTKHVSYFVS